MSAYMRLRDFALAAEAVTLPFSRHISHNEFKVLYLRWWPPYEGIYPNGCVAVATVQSLRPGKGAFRRLVRELRERFPRAIISVESVINVRFAAHLRNHGWEAFGDSDNPVSFQLPVDKMPYSDPTLAPTRRDKRPDVSGE